MLRYETNVPSGQVIQVCLGDLTEDDSEAIVNAANSSLAHGGGVAGAIVHRGGQAIQVESQAWIRLHGEVPTGKVAVTGAGSLPSRYVIHAVGPVWYGGRAGEDDLLSSAVRNSLLKAEALKLNSIALPAISSGIFGFPKLHCAQIMLAAIFSFFEGHPQSNLGRVRLTNIDLETTTIFENSLKDFKSDSHEL